MRAYYYDDYPMKCLQSSVAIQLLLEQLCIRSKPFVGAVCFSQVYNDENSLPDWGGFWGEDHHVWLITEFGELVDLTISESHKHPARKRRDILPIPAIWWNDPEYWPPIIRYLPEGPVRINLPQDEKADLEIFKVKFLDIMKYTLKKKCVHEIGYSPILSSIDTLNSMTESGNTWLRKSRVIQDRKIPFPQWVQQREAQLNAEYKKRNA